jgi:glycosyltransferase involved in cell wall biosynthesis
MDCNGLTVFLSENGKVTASMSSALPLVTVLILAFNAEETIGQALDSALAPDYSATEIVIDDGSIDATSVVVAGGYRQQESRLLQLPCTLGEGGVLNEGIVAARGRYIAFLDADGEWLPCKLSRQIAVLESNPKATMATCRCRFAEGSGKEGEEFGRKPAGIAKDQMWRFLLAAACIAKPCVVVRTSAFHPVGLFDTALPVAADRDMWIRLARPAKSSLSMSRSPLRGLLFPSRSKAVKRRGQIQVPGHSPPPCRAEGKAVR